MKVKSSQISIKKLNYFTNFVNQYFLLNNNSVLPVDPPQLTTIYLDSINILSSDIAKIHLDQNKVHDHYMLSIRMTKLCKNSICKPLSKISNDCLNESKSPHEWKKANVHVHSKRKNRV